MAEQPSHADLASQIGALQAQMADTRQDVKEIRSDVSELKQAAQMGRGAWWALMKLGGIMVVLSGVGAWLWQHFGGK